MNTAANGGGSVDHEPNSFGSPAEDPSVKKPPLRINRDGAQYVIYPGDDTDLYAQPRSLWEKVLDGTGRAHLVENIVGSMTMPAVGLEDDAKVREIQQRMLKHWYKVYPDFGAAVEKGIDRVNAGWMKQAAA